jgi:peptide methionine sulfoxide reductase msrA/msrB
VVRVAAVALALAVVPAVIVAGMQPEGNSMKNVAVKGPVFSKSGFDVTPWDKAKVDAAAKKLTKAEADVILAKGTEPAFCGNLVDNHKDGVYVCRLCGLPLFSSDAKFDSGTGWPSFFQPYDKAHVHEETDRSHGMVRSEILCARCGAHLGHVFDDGPRDKTGLRFCLNSVSLMFYEKGQELPAESKPLKTETAYFAGGCFWGVEDQFEHLPGVVDAVSGYMGGQTKNPTYEDVCTHTTGHAETVKVVYDPAKVTYQELLAYFFKIHDPTQANGQGPDIGDNYRSAIFANTPDQEKAAKAFIEDQQKTNKRFAGRKVVTQVVAPGPAFYEAEEYHQDYDRKHGRTCPLPER